jgi:hypothetical protein
MCRNSSVGIVIRLWAARAGYDFRQVLGIILFATASRTALGPTQTLIQRGGSFPGSKVTGT